jgi:hypothetical protein
MNIFIIGLPQSGRTTVAKAIAEAHGYQYIDAMSWVRSAFREIHKGEHLHQYEDEYQQYLTKRMIINPWFITDYLFEMMKVGANEGNIFIIDGLQSPRDFVTMFDYRTDIVVFLNRTDNEHEFRDHENIGSSAIRDYCFWMSSAGLCNKTRWLEYNFRIPGEDSDNIKQMGAQNSVFIVKSIQKVISHLTGTIREIVNAVS